MEFAGDMMLNRFAPARIKHERGSSFEAPEQATPHGE